MTTRHKIVMPSASLADAPYPPHNTPDSLWATSVWLYDVGAITTVEPNSPAFAAGFAHAVVLLRRATSRLSADLATQEEAD